MHRSDFSFETVNALGSHSSRCEQLNLHDWLARTIEKLSQQARRAETDCRPSSAAGYYYIAHGQTTHHLSSYETYRFLQSILWLYNLEGAKT